jgi:intracellular sulfur oxidation DsrE/DsrF family protein
MAVLSPAGLLAFRTRSNAAVRAQLIHRVAIHVDVNDPATMNLALSNARNMYEYFASNGERLDVRLIAYGPGLNMLREDSSPVKERLSSMKKQFPSLTLAACGNTKRNMEIAEGKPIVISPLAEIVPSGVVELIKLQEHGWKYLRP